MEFVIGKRRRWNEGGYGVSDVLQNLQRLWDALDGTEKLDRIRVASLLSDLKALQNEIKSVRAPGPRSDPGKPERQV